ncbi:MAG: hypothetical protein LBV74_08675 [Tannerella sp.]|jgi:hypothetical protein|nr:hypothetical protein [Tannerella sp.]
MKKEEDKMYGTYPLPEVDIAVSLRRYYFSIPGEVYDRNPALFRRAIRFMQKKRDLKGEAHIFNKCVNAATNRAAREFVLPVLLGTVAPLVILEAGPVVMAAHTFSKAIYTNPTTWIRMGVNWGMQTYAYGIKEVDYVSVVAEGFTVGGSALSALVEFRPAIKEGPKLKIGFIDKSFGDTSVDIVTCIRCSCC